MPPSTPTFNSSVDFPPGPLCARGAHGGAFVPRVSDGRASSGLQNDRVLEASLEDTDVLVNVEAEKPPTVDSRSLVDVENMPPPLPLGGASLSVRFIRRRTAEKL